MRSWTGLPAVDRAQRPVGAIADVYLSRADGEPEFVLLDLGGGAQTPVPLENARLTGGVLYLDVDADRVAAAPPGDGGEELTPEYEVKLYEHYGHTPPAVAPDAAATTELPEGAAVDGAGDEGATMTVSEEQLVVDTQARATERVRVRKRVVTEEVTVTIPLRREELVIEREPIEPGAAEAPSDAQIVEAEFDFLLLAEQPVIEKRIVPVEQVRVRKDVVVEEELVSDQVRKERVDVEHDPSTPTT